jgi:hypothetical protein
MRVNYDLLTREQITAEGALHILPEAYETTLRGELKDNEEFFLELPSENNLDGVLAPLGTFITNELNIDFQSEIRDSAVLWTAGHLQGIFPDLTNEPEGDNSVGDNEIVQPKDKEKGHKREKFRKQGSSCCKSTWFNQPGFTSPHFRTYIECRGACSYFSASRRAIGGRNASSEGGGKNLQLKIWQR